MRGSLGRRLPNPNITIPTTILPSSFSSFSTSSGRGRGRGGDHGGGPGKFNFIRAPGEPPHSDESNSESSNQGGLGHGRGKPLPSTPSLPSSFSSFVNPTPTGRGGGDSKSQPFAPKQPVFFSKTDVSDQFIPHPPIGANLGKKREDLPSSILSVLSIGDGAGRGKPGAKPQPGPEQQVKEVDRHFRPPRQPGPGRGRGPPVAVRDAPPGPKLSREDAVKKAVSILSRGGGGGDEGGGDGRGRAVRGRGRGRGNRGRGPRRGRSDFRGRGDRRDKDEDDEDGGLYLGDDADGEKLATKVGPDTMNKLVDAFEEMSYRVLPSPEMDCFVDALDTNLAIELEPEYLMADFASNPDIDETPPIPLRDALEKMKPFLMVYEGIQSQEEWEEIIEETMDRVPLLKEIVDHYSGPDRVTAKKQQEELERVAKTLPQSAPTSVQRFTNRAVLSLQSNPGWGFDKKCQFMDKLVWEVSQQYK